MFSKYISWRNRAFSIEEAVELFDPEYVNISGENEEPWGEEHTIISFKPKFSPYGENGPMVCFIDPELPQEHDGSLHEPNILKNDLFKGGYYVAGDWSGAYPCFVGGFSILIGNFDTEKDTFTVHGHGLSSGHGSDILLLNRRSSWDGNSAKVAAEIAKVALRASSFRTANDEKHNTISDVFILNGGVCFSRNGKSTKKYYGFEEHIRALQRERFSPVFEFECINDGVAYSQAWVIDEHGSPISFIEVDKPSRSGRQTKRWDNLRSSDICIYCEVCPDGEIRLCAARVSSDWHCIREVKATELQRCRMYLIRQQICAEVKANREPYLGIMKYPAPGVPEWKELGHI